MVIGPVTFFHETSPVIIFPIIRTVNTLVCQVLRTPLAMAGKNGQNVISLVHSIANSIDNIVFIRVQLCAASLQEPHHVIKDGNGH